MFYFLARIKFVKIWKVLQSHCLNMKGLKISGINQSALLMKSRSEENSVVSRQEQMLMQQNYFGGVSSLTK